MKKKYRAWMGISVIAVVLLITTAILFLPANFPSYAKAQHTDFRINKGDSLDEITQSLYQGDLLRSPLIFKILFRLSGQSSNIKAGLYRLTPNMSIADYIRVFSQGRYVDEDVSITIYEGSNLNDIDSAFANAGLSKPGDFITSELLAKEGYLFPDTYRFMPGTPLNIIVLKLESNFLGKVNFTVTPHAIIVASILEKEVRTPQDMGLVAGIIEKRLSLGMLLQIDAIVGYGECRKQFVLGKKCETSDVGIREAIKKPGPYNSYKTKGLPPTPISNPGSDSIKAALNPIKSDYLYYLTDHNGNMHYAKTGAEHERNRRMYLGGN